MKSVLLMSPHLDDAVLSAGQFIAGRPDCDVATFFAGYPENDLQVKTEYDKNSGFQHAKDAMSVRRSEDAEALALLKAVPIHLDFLDNQYDRTIDQDKLVEAAHKMMTQEDYEFILAPLGLSHPNHQQLSDAVLEANEKLRLPLFLWEDMPNRMLTPEYVDPRKEYIKDEFDISLEMGFPGDGELAMKIRAIWCYKSQLWSWSPHILFVPERYWRVVYG